MAFSPVKVSVTAVNLKCLLFQNLVSLPWKRFQTIPRNCNDRSQWLERKKSSSSSLNLDSFTPDPDWLLLRTRDWRVMASFGTGSGVRFALSSSHLLILLLLLSSHSSPSRRLWSCDNFLKMFKHDDYNGALLYLFGSATSLLANHLDGKKSFYAQNKFYRFFGWWWITHYLPIVLSYLITSKRIQLETCGWSQIVEEKKIFPDLM